MRTTVWATLTIFCGIAAAQPTTDPESSPEARGRAIAAESERREEGFGATVTELVMTLSNAEGRRRTRRLTWKTLEGTAPGEGDRSLTLFHDPPDIEGTAFLSHTYTDREDDQWLFLPALKRVKRIASSNQSSAFVGSEFAYEDLLSDEVAKYDYRWLRDEECEEATCFVVQRRPRYANSGYSRQIVWMDQSEFRPIRIEFFDRNDRLRKTLTFEDYRRYLDRFWRAHRLTMTNHRSGKITVLDFSSFDFQTGLGERDFDPSVLRRLR